MPYTTPPIIQRLTSNPVASRSDLIALLHDLISPLAESQSTGGARVRIGHTGTHFDTGAAEFEGYARALWGLTPLWAAEPDRPEFKTWRERWVEGLRNGTDETHEEYWGEVRDRDQRMVEMAAIGFSLILAPKVFWDPLSDKQKENVAKWLLPSNDHEFPDNNWRYFRIFLNLGLKLNNAPHSQTHIDDSFEFMEQFIHPESGFPADGVQPCRAYDYYATSFAIPFYSLIYAKVCGEQDPKRAAAFRQRARENIGEVVHLFGTDGAAISYGRSMTYRFACAAFFAALAFDEFDLPAPFTWGIIKGIVLRHIRWFTQKQGIYNRDGTLTIGWAYPQMYLSEDYNSAQSPYWALKSLLILALPETHPFWAAEEAPYPAELLAQAAHPAPQWGQTFTHAGGHDYLLCAGPAVKWPMRGAGAKYGKLAYSAQFGFSLPSGDHGLKGLAPDSTLALSDDAARDRWVSRMQADEWEMLNGGVLRSVWKAFNDVTVTTYLVPPHAADTPYHTRIHHIVAARQIEAFDGGWAIHSHTGPSEMSERRLPTLSSLDPQTPGGGVPHGRWQGSGAALAHSSKGMSGVLDLLGNGQAQVIDVDGCTNIVSPRTVVPGVMHSVAPGKEGVWIGTRVWGVPYKGAKGEEGWAGRWNEAMGAGKLGLGELKKELKLDF